ncbi:hypothetical protein KUV50_16200 [Membranicola marinus]|uniref:Uncharacterized protein n=1 Tax=Membranihabitans marinus TaxID=1227546 RepID=A0A953L8D2_9BACT|nr:hypothetical protein [Membranihabitans marinus]
MSVGRWGWKQSDGWLRIVLVAALILVFATLM